MRKITIEITDLGVNTSSEGMNTYEIMGVLRFVEKQLFVKICQAHNKEDDVLSEHPILIDNTECSERLKNIAKVMEVTKWSDFCKFTKREILKYQHCGLKTVHEIIDQLEVRKLTLNQK